VRAGFTTTRIALGGIALFSVVAASFAIPRNDSAAADVGTFYSEGLARFDASLVRLDASLQSADVAAMQRAFRDSRASFKRIEAFVEYFGSFAARDLNGPPLWHPEDEDPEAPLPPSGLQVIEAAVFPTLDTSALREARRQIAPMRARVSQLVLAGVDTMPGDAFFFDAMKHEIARVASLGIAGFDATVSGDAILEAAMALDGVSEALAPYRAQLERRGRASLDTLDARLDRAARYARENADFDTFDRLRFIRDYIQPVAHALGDAQSVLAIGPPPRPRAWSAKATSMFDRDAYDPMYFASTDAQPASSGVVALGRELFFDTTLTPTSGRSCASCHAPERAFTDGRQRAQLIAGHVARGGGRNTPTLINAGLQPTLFADNRVRTLEDQATDVLGSASEMGGSLDGATAVLRRRGYADRFSNLFRGWPDSTLSPRTVRLALAAYVRSLVALDSPFDRAVRGDSTALTPQERLGFNLFMGKATCGTCHFAPMFNGAGPPTLFESEPEVIGVPSNDLPKNAVIDPDSGRFNVRRIDLHLGAFKTPTLRNVALTAPYMHNGVFQTLDDVVRFYDGGGGRGMGVRGVTQTLPSDSLHLTATERDAIVAFMKTLTDTAGTTTRPLLRAHQP
jgi:cytochrome c peroxidase